MIESSQTVLLLLFAESLLSGAFLGLAYDTLMALGIFLGVPYGDRNEKNRTRSAVSSVYIFFADFTAVISAAIASLLLIYRFGGVFRWLVYIGIFGGYFICRTFFRRIFRKPLFFAARISRKLFLKLFFAVSYPFVIIFKGIVFIYHLTIGKIIGKILSWIKKRREARELLDNERLSARGEEQTPIEKNEGDGYVYVGKNNGYRKNGRINFGDRGG